MIEDVQTFNRRKGPVMKKAKGMIRKGIALMFMIAALLPGARLYAEAGGTKMGQNPLYADMEKRDGRYVITRISPQPLLFRLNDLEPQFDIHDYPCTRHAGNFAPEVINPAMCRNDEKTFRRVKTDFWKTLASDFLTIGANILRGEVEEYSGFEADEYRKAVEEALANTGLDREKVLGKYDELLKSAKDLKTRAGKEYARILKEGLTVEFPLRIEDRSGFYKNDLTGRDLVRIRENQIPDLDVRTAVFNAVDTAFLEKALEGLKEKYELEVSQATACYRLAKLTGARQYSVLIDAPDKVFISDGSRQTIPLNVTVSCKTFTGVSPYYLSENADLRLEDDGKTIQFFNKTAQFLVVETLSAHYGKRQTQTALNTELPPGAFVSLERSDPRLSLPLRDDFFNIKKDSVAGWVLYYGYDVDYRIAGQRPGRTLRKVQEYNLYDILMQ